MSDVDNDAAKHAADGNPVGQSPLELLTTALEVFFKDHSREQTLALWASYASLSPEQACRILAAFDDVIATPPDDLRTLLLDHGWINLFHDREGTPEIYTQAEHREWLTHITEDLRRLCDCGSRSRA